VFDRVIVRSMHMETVSGHGLTSYLLRS
jgi:hypothetical protein